MTKQEFYHRLLRSINDIFRSSFLSRKELVTYLKQDYNRKIFESKKSYLTYIKLYKTINWLSYKEACMMYDALEDREWEFQDNQIVLHYPEIKMEKGNIINDLYLKFDPIISNIIYHGPDLRALRSTYTPLEYKFLYCHPHISFRRPDYGFHDSICFGDTPFNYSDNIALNFISYLEYLDVYLKHEWEDNPYFSTKKLIERAQCGYSLNQAFNLSELDYKFVSYNGLEQVVIDFTENSIKYLKSIYLPILTYEINGLSFGEINIDEYDTDYNETFKGEPITLKIIQPTKLVFNHDFAEKLNAEICHKLTKTYMEAFSDNFGQSLEPVSVSLQEDSQ